MADKESRGARRDDGKKKATPAAKEAARVEPASSSKERRCEDCHSSDSETEIGFAAAELQAYVATIRHLVQHGVEILAPNAPKVAGITESDRRIVSELAELVEKMDRGARTVRRSVRRLSPALMKAIEDRCSDSSSDGSGSASDPEVQAPSAQHQHSRKE